MNGYTGEFSFRQSVLASRSFTGGLTGYSEILRVTNPTGSAYYATDPGNPTSGDGSPSRFRIEVKAMQNDMSLQGKIRFVNIGIGGATTLDMVAYGDTTAAFLIGGGIVKYYELSTYPYGVFNDSAIWVDYASATGSARAEVVIRIRPYAFPGWEQANVVAATMLSQIEPGIVNSPMGRQAAATGYTAEMTAAKDEIARRLRADGIDLDMIPTDACILNTGANAPQTYCKYLIPELADAGTYLTLYNIHQRYASRNEDWDTYKAEMYHRRFVEAYAQGLRTLPLNFTKDFQLTTTESKQGFDTRLTL